MKEQQLYTYWEQLGDEEATLKTQKGEDVRVIGTGKRTLRSGPDYSGCILEIDGEIWTGDVEIHVDEQDWMRHGHDRDPSFDHVKLHFVAHPASRRVSPEQIRRTVRIDSNNPANGRSEPDVSTMKSSSILCPAGSGLYDSPDRIPEALEAIERLGWQRIQRNKQELEWAGDSTHRLRTFSTVMGSSLGLHANREPAKRVMNALDVRWLKQQLQSIGHPASAQCFGESVLFTIAGLLNITSDYTGQPASRRWRSYLKDLSDVRHGVEPAMSGQSWNLSDVRPVNTPYRRLAGWLALFRRFFVGFSIDQVESFLLNRVEQAYCDSDMRLTDLIGLFSVTPDEVDTYWNDHSKPGHQLPGSMALVGEHRAALLWINGLLPYLLRLSSERDRSDVHRMLRGLTHQSRLPLGDQRTRTVSNQLFGTESGDVRQTGATDQGMHELFTAYCRYGSGGCSRCPINDKVK